MGTDLEIGRSSPGRSFFAYCNSRLLLCTLPHGLYGRRGTSMNWSVRLVALLIVLLGFPTIAQASDDFLDLNGPCPNDDYWTIRVYSDSTKSNPHYRCYPPCGINERVIIFKDGMEYLGNLITCDFVIDLPLQPVGVSSQAGAPSQTGSFSQAGCSDLEIRYVQNGNHFHEKRPLEDITQDQIAQLSGRYSVENIRSNLSVLCNGLGSGG